MNTSNIEGIPCSLRNLAVRRFVKGTLRRIRSQYPNDLKRLRSIVRCIAPLDVQDAGERARGCVGRWERDDPIIEESPGVVRVVKDIPNAWSSLTLDDMPGVLAHELGHAATREIDLTRRGVNPLGGDLTSELAADWYAYRWGFGREIARHRGKRDRTHSGPAPGSTFGVQEAGIVHTYEITRSFVIRRQRSRPGGLELSEEECLAAMFGN